jgi:hypothetical protein
MKSQRIKTGSDEKSDRMFVGGWLQGRRTYLRFEDEKGDFMGSIGGQKLYRLAKAIVKHYESDKP